MRQRLQTGLFLLAATLGAAHAQTSMAFLSPNTRDGMTYDDARRSWSSFEQKNFEAISDRVLCSMASKATIAPMLNDAQDPGVGVEGMENAEMLEAPIPFEDMRYAAALLGRYAHQKYVGVFSPGGSGGTMVTFTTPAPFANVRAALVRAGVKFRTYARVGNQWRVVEFADGKATEAAARELGVKAEKPTGQDALIGDDDRTKAMAKYDAIIKEYEAAHPAHALSSKLWSREWHDAETRTCTASK